MSKAPLPFDPIEEARRQWVAHGWEEAAAGMAAVTSIARAHQILLARIDEVLRPYDLTFARYEVLMLLHFSRAGRLPMTVIGTRLQVHPTSVSSAVARLERQGFVERTRDPEDRRSRLAEITELGRERALAATEKLNHTVFADPGLAPAETDEVITALRHLRRRAGDF